LFPTIKPDRDGRLSATREEIVNQITGRSQGTASGRHYGVFQIRRDRIELEKMVCPV
jgi:hypothetical protein